MIKRTISVILVFCIFTGLLSIPTGCSGSYPFKKGATIEATIKTGNDNKNRAVLQKHAGSF